MNDLERRVQRIEDRFAITDLVVRFMARMDETEVPDPDPVLDMFTEDAVVGEATNRVHAVKLLRAIRRNYGRTVHTPRGHTVEVHDDDTATGIVLGHADLDIGGVSYTSVFRYRDEYARGADGQWRFTRRDFDPAYVIPMADLAESMTSELPVRWPGLASAPSAW